MPSGGITITPGFQFAPQEKVNNTKLNQLGQPVGRVDEGAIGSRELDAGLTTTISGLKGKNLFCNGAFQIWYNGNYSGLHGTLSHDIGPVARWVVANDANRLVTWLRFDTGSTEIPSGIDFLRWTQSATLVPNPAYLGQRMEDVRRFSGVTLAFSIYLRANSNLTVTPKLRQVFGSVKRTIQSSIVVNLGTGNQVSDGANSFRASDVGASITITGPGFTTLNSTITGFTNAGLVSIAATVVLTGVGLTAAITGVAGSAAVVVVGQPVSLIATEWTRLEQVFNVPDVTGKTIPDVAISSFTEFRVDVPPGTSFQIDFANAQLEFGAAATPFERRLMHEDLAYARYYFEYKWMKLSNNLGVWLPFMSVDKKCQRPIVQIAGISGGGTGGVVGLEPASEVETAGHFITQNGTHSVIASAIVQADAEIRD